MKSMTKIAVGVFAAAASLNATAGTFLASSAAVGVEAAKAKAFKGTVGAGNIELKPGETIPTGDRIFLSLTGGATFADAGYYLATSGTSITTSLVGHTAGASTLEFRVTSGGVAGGDLILSSSDVATPVALKVGLPAAAAGTKISISGYAQEQLGQYDTYKAAEIFRYFKEFSAAVDTQADGIIDVDAERLKFTSGVNYDDIVVNFKSQGLANGVTLATADKLVVTLEGDMSGLADIKAFANGTSAANIAKAKTATINAGKTSAVYTFDANTVEGTSSAVLRLTGATSEPIATREFKVGVVLELDTEASDEVLINSSLEAAKGNAGKWTINGLQAKVSQMSLQTPGFISWLKVANTGTVAVDVIADIIWTLADGTEGAVNGAKLGTIDAGGVGTISEAAILDAMGDPSKLADAHLTVTVTGSADTVHLIAEKKASDGRTSIPVYYNATNGRNWFQ